VLVWLAGAGHWPEHYAGIYGDGKATLYRVEPGAELPAIEGIVPRAGVVGRGQDMRGSASESPAGAALFGNLYQSHLVRVEQQTHRATEYAASYAYIFFFFLVESR
jgi:hypothetical protein